MHDPGKACGRKGSAAGWSRPARFDRNLIVIGAGAGGLVASYIAATVRAKVTLVERARMGGDCLNTGCVPSKALIRSGRLLQEIRNAQDYGIASTTVEFHFADLMERVQRVIARIAPHDSRERYTALGVDVREGEARLVSPWAVEITDPAGKRETLTTRAVILATGAEPRIPPIPGLAEAGFLTSETLWDLRECPRRLLVLGGGPIGCELGQTLQRLGTQVTLVEQGTRLLPREDPECAERLEQQLRAEGMTLLTGCRALRVERVGQEKILVIANPHLDANAHPHANPLPGTHPLPGTDALPGTHPLPGTGALPGTDVPLEQRLPFDAILVCVGRVPRLHGLGLETLGITLPGTTVAPPAEPILPQTASETPSAWARLHGFCTQQWQRHTTKAGTGPIPPADATVLQINAYLQTQYPNLLVCGDAIGQWSFTHVAAHTAWFATVNALFGTFWRLPVDYRVIPWCTFTDPEIARVGLNETEAKARGIRHEVTTYALEDLDRAIVDEVAYGWIKVLTPPGKDQILGVTIVGAHAGELLAEFVLAMRNGLGLQRILGTLHSYPTFSEANRQVAGVWRKAHSPERLLRWLERFHTWRRGR